MQLVPLIAILGSVFLVYHMVLKKGMLKPRGGGGGGGGAVARPSGDAVDLGMYDSYNPNAFGTTNEEDRRVTNYGVRREFHHNPYPLGDGCGDCDKYGVPDPAMGHTHVCTAGPPSKRMIDAVAGSHFSLPHMCAPATGVNQEPLQLGRWWKRKGCAAPESVGLNLRPLCTRCGN